jgi:hypothetical protein
MLISAARAMTALTIVCSPFATIMTMRKYVSPSRNNNKRNAAICHGNGCQGRWQQRRPSQNTVRWRQHRVLSHLEEVQLHDRINSGSFS